MRILCPIVLLLLLVPLIASAEEGETPQQAAEEPPVFEETLLLPPLPEAIPPGPPSPPTPQDRLPSLTLDDLERIAMACNPTLVQAGMMIRAAQGTYVQAGLYPNPVMGYLNDDTGIEGTRGMQGMFVAQEIIIRGKRRLGRAVASHEVQQARAVYEAQLLRVLNGVRAGYYETLVAQKTIEINQQLVHIATESVGITEKLRAAKEVSQADVLQARIEAERETLNLVVSRNHYQGAWRRLAAVLGRPGAPPSPLAGNVEDNLATFTWEESRDRLLSESPELAQAYAALERAKCDLALQRAERIENPAIGGAVKYDHATGGTVADVAIEIPLPLFNRNQGNVATAQANLVSAQREVRRVELDLSDRLATAFEGYANARRQVDAYLNTIVPNAKASLELNRRGYEEGEFGYLELLTAQRTYFSANLDYLSSLGELWATSVELEGLLLSGGLERPE